MPELVNVILDKVGCDGVSDAGHLHPVQAVKVAHQAHQLVPPEASVSHHVPEHPLHVDFRTWKLAVILGFDDQRKRICR